MNDWLPVVAGCCIIALALAVARFAPHSVWGQELGRSCSVRRAARECARVATTFRRLAAIGAVVSWRRAWAPVGDGRLPVDSTGSWIGMSYGFVAFLLAVMARS
jgi:hypothetical protein